MIKIYNAWIAQITENKITPVFGDITINKGKISSVTKRTPDDVIDVEENSSHINAHSRIVTIPNINFHDHFYSRLAKGLAITGSMENFEEVLKNLWWKLDLALDEEMVKASVQLALLESIKNGVTYIFDHHASPSYISGSLSLIANQIKDFGLRGVVCFEASDRNGEKLSEESIYENIDFCKNKSDDEVKGLIGLHASFTLNDDTLKNISGYVKESGTGIHIHLCEDIVDRDRSIKLYGDLPVQRLEKFNLLNDRSIVAHGIHLNKDDYRTLLKNNVALVYNLDSNMNNSVGLPQFLKVPSDLTILAGTDGMHANMARSNKEIFLHHRHQGNSFNESFEWMNRSYFNQINFVKKFFPDFTNLMEGDRADLVMWDYVPPAPLHKNNFWGHYLYGLTERRVANVIQNGKLLLKEYNLVDIDESQLNQRIAIQGARLSEKFSAI